jgi:NCAIR mutase (PurE)-related protein
MPSITARARMLGATTVATALGASLEYFLDPAAGRRRRHTVRDKVMSAVRRGERRALRRARRAESRTVGMARRMVNARRNHAEPVDDVALAHRVETDLFRDVHVAKGNVDINAEEGTVFLRGVVEQPEEIERIALLAAGIPGVHAVENLLHLPGTPAPASRPKLVRNNGHLNPE